MIHPLRKVVSWDLKKNPQPFTFPRSGEQWHARMECGHVLNFGGGPKPTLMQYRCAECAQIEPEAA